MWLFAHYVWKSVEICPNPKGQSIWLIVITKLGCENKIMLHRPLVIIAIIAIAVLASSRLETNNYPLRHLVLINTRLSDFNQFIKLTNFVFHEKSKKREKQHQMEKEKVKSCFMARFLTLIKWGSVGLSTC